MYFSVFPPHVVSKLEIFFSKDPVAVAVNMLDPVIKVRHKATTPPPPPSRLVLLLLSLLLFAPPPPAAEAQICDKTPLEYIGQEKTPGNNGYEVNIIGKPRLYRPNQQYTITLTVRPTHFFVHENDP